MTIKTEGYQEKTAKRDSSMGPEDDEYLEDFVSPHLICSYLLHHGHMETAQVFLRDWQQSCESGAEISDSHAYRSLPFRHHLTKSILAGNIEEAILSIRREFPTMAGANGLPSESYFKLLCQHFVELVRSGRPDDALRYAETDLAPLANQFPVFSPELQNVIVLLAYADPVNSPVTHLLSFEYRTAIAEELNAAILGQKESALERIVKQTMAVSDLLSHYDPNHICKDQGDERKSFDLSNFAFP